VCVCVCIYINRALYINIIQWQLGAVKAKEILHPYCTIEHSNAHARARPRRHRALALEDESGRRRATAHGGQADTPATQSTHRPVPLPLELL
jgi:hypothetical protein